MDAPEKTLQDFIRESPAKDTGALAATLRAAVPPEEAARIRATEDEREKAIAALKTVKDPEIPVNIWDLGLVYRLEVSEDAVFVEMTLTAPTCPVAEMIPQEAKARLQEFFTEKSDIRVELVWQPAWDRSRMSDEARLLLDMW
jgi:metal-sulfur cluster biosynthetic enzyme